MHVEDSAQKSFLMHRLILVVSVASSLEVAGAALHFKVAVSAGVGMGGRRFVQMLANGTLVEVLPEAHNLWRGWAFVKESSQRVELNGGNCEMKNK